MGALSRQQVRRVDRLAIDELGIPGLVLMENAGINATACIVELLGRPPGRGLDDARVAVVCGGGNNGGDGYVIARHLHNRGADVCIHAAVERGRLRGDCLVNAAACARLGVSTVSGVDPARLADREVVVDALLGTGFAAPMRPAMAAAIEQVNAADGPRVVAIDLPSGLDCDTGEPSEPTVRADLTVTFVASKLGFENPASRPHTGPIRVVGIGVPDAWAARAASGA